MDLIKILRRMAFAIQATGENSPEDFRYLAITKGHLTPERVSRLIIINPGRRWGYKDRSSARSAEKAGAASENYPRGVLDVMLVIQPLLTDAGCIFSRAFAVRLAPCEIHHFRGISEGDIAGTQSFLRGGGQGGERGVMFACPGFKRTAAAQNQGCCK